MIETKILARKFLTQENYFLYLYKPDDYNFIPGQYLALRVDELKATRLYSIASLPEEPFLMLYIKKVGLVSEYLQKIPIDSKVKISKPLGNFTIDKSKNKKIVFIAMGTGIAPVRPMVYYGLKEGKEIYVIHQEKTKEHLAFKEEFELLNINYIPILSREKSKYYGHVQDYIDEFIFEDADYFIVGNRNFVEEIEKILKSKRINNIFIEKF